MKTKAKIRDGLRPSGSVMTLYLLPGLLIYLLIFIFPSVMSLLLSLFKFTSIKSFQFIGLANYKTLIADSNVLLALKNNLFLVGVCLIGQIGLALTLAGLLNSSMARLSNVYRTLIFFPVTLSAVVIGYVWKMVYDYNYGIIAFLLKAFGHGDMVNPWLSQADTVMTAVSIPMIWQYVGFHLVILLSAMTSIDKSVYEMAEVDGANGFQRMFKITLPLIRGTIMLCVFLCISANMKAFDHILAMTNGGPGFSSSVLALYAYKVSFSQMNMGYGSAVSVFVLVVTMCLFLISRLVMSIRKD